MLCFPNAKINIGLNITEKRSDGYHNLETVFCPLDLADILEFVSDQNKPAGNFRFEATGIPIEGPSENNLCIRAYQLLNKDFRLPSVTIHLHKIIPLGAGLGGGSSDGAFMLKGLNSMFDLKLSENQLCEYASMLGSDCAFFIRNRPLYACERGNCFKEISFFPEKIHAAVIYPGIHVSTAMAYSGIQPKKPLHSLEELIKLPPEEWKGNILNSFEDYISKLYPVISEIKNKLYNMGAFYASMSGSGSAVYGLFKEQIPALKDEFPGNFTWEGTTS